MRTLLVGDELPVWELPITPTLVVSGALATRDFQDVHHDRDRAVAAGSKDIFVNILTSTALCERYVTDWVGTDVEIRGIAIRLGAPAYPGDTFTFSGSVAAIEDGIATIALTGAVSLGAHVFGTVKVALR
ncbi:MaoC family dehydratase [Nocardioides sp.]|uniref:MaoC family dehydratase n=1 Tax=Nocardioides sp. TaxID=35761 RepID=UPI0026189AE6|nr:MaoC family dehydratase [Nocardioides sp.]